MTKKYLNSLRKLLIVQEVAFLLLLAVTGLLGGLSAYFWQQNSEESVRLNSLSYVTEQIRSDLFQQIQAAIRARLLEDVRSLELYSEYSRRIDKNFNKLRSSAITRKEDVGIQDLHVSYRTIQKDMNAIFVDPYAISLQIRMKILDPRFAERMIGRFEGKYGKLKHMLAEERKVLNNKLEIWSRYAPIVITIPLLMAFLLVIYARTTFRREFLKPISEIIIGARRIRVGHLETKMPEQGVEEIKDLSGAINKMSNDLQTSQSALVESEKQAALGALVPVVAHNIRNPLASIRATAQLLDDSVDKEDLEESKNAIIETTDRLSRWVNALVSYLHPLKPNYRLVLASEMLNAAIALLKPKMEEKQIKLDKVDWENDLRLNADPDLMEQAIYALVANAIDASPKLATLTITLVKKDTELELSIQDQGTGLPFNPKPNQLTPGPSTKSFGTGLGIPIAFKICQKHGWNLNFYSPEKDGVQEGTTVTITAPIRVIEENDDE
jgi:signal transduction histidine kinase